MRTLMLVLGITAILGAACAQKKTITTTELATLMPDYATVSESVTSLIANQLGAVSGAPTPGAMGHGSCFEAVCGADETASGAQALYRKSSLGCRTSKVAIDGSTYMRASGIPEFGGCATGTGPFSFRHWPPASGHVLFSTGDPVLFSDSVPDRPTANTLDRLDPGMRLTRHWGLARLEFNGTKDAAITIDHWLQQVDGNRRDNDPDANYFHFTSQPGMVLHMESPWDEYDRVFTGGLLMYDRSHHVSSTVTMNNLRYQKTACCHPIGGSMAVVSNIDDAPREGALTREIQFTIVCGHALVHDGLGRRTELELPTCTSF